MAEMPFDDLKVLDFTWWGVGPITMKYLADHGATVVHIESTTRTDGLRSSIPMKEGFQGLNASAFAGNFNSSKFGLGLNMALPQSRDLIRRIIAEWQPDIIGESFTPKTMRNWELDYPNVKEIKPDIIFFSTCQQGQTGPNSLQPGFGNLAASVGGIYHVTGWPDRPPVSPYGAYSDFINPPNALAAIVGALEYRRRTGKGQHLDLSQFECTTHFFAPALMDYQINNRIANRRGNKDDSHVPHNVYPCKERPPDPDMERTGGYWCAIAVTCDEEWNALCGVMGDPDWSREERFATFSARRENEEELDRLVAERTVGWDAWDLMETLQGCGVPAGVVQSQSDMRNDPQLEHRGFWQWREHPEVGQMPYDGLQFLLSKTPGGILRHQAMIGEHNEMILKEWVGLSDEEFLDLLLSDALETS